MTTRRAATIGLILLAGIALAGCTEEPSGPGVGSPSPSSSAPVPGETPDDAEADAEAESDEALLPMPADEIKDWAKTAVPGSDSAGYAFGFSGWLSEHTSGRSVARFESLEPGSYQAQVACRGGGTIALVAGQIDAESSADPIMCTDESIAFEVTTVATGVQFELDLDGAPTIYAVSLLRLD